MPTTIPETPPVNDHRAHLAKAHEKMAQMRAEGWKPVILNPVDKAKSKPNSLKLAIRAHCWTCMGEDHDPGVRIRVRDCTLEGCCALWPHRPWQTMGETSESGMDDDGADDPDTSQAQEA